MLNVRFTVLTKKNLSLILSTISFVEWHTRFITIPLNPYLKKYTKII